MDTSITTRDLMWYFRGTPDHRLAGVRRGVADVLEGKADTTLLRALAVAYGDPEQWIHVEAMERGYRRSDVPALATCGRIIESARGELWDRGLAAL
jgi:hypothetical protein